MPLLLAIPLIAGLAGLFVGTQVENKINNPTQVVAAPQPDKMPWYVTLAIIVIISIVAIMLIKKIIKKI